MALSSGAGLLFKAVGSFIWPTESSAWFLLTASLGCIAAALYLHRR
ncbi:hypothetical protein [Deinococcus psychrotolerans]|nr:hypothetical protein [Deinococcus psychrotolerans]